MQSNIGLYKKYNITKADGSPVDPSAQYFILCPTTDLDDLMRLYSHPALPSLMFSAGEPPIT